MNAAESPGSSRPDDVDAFETLLWELFLRFVDLPGDKVDAAIRDAQRRVCETLDLDRASLWQVIPGDELDMRPTHVYEGRPLAVRVDEQTGIANDGPVPVFPVLDGVAFPADASARVIYPWITQRILAGQTTVVPSPDDLPAEAAVDVLVLRRFETVSTVIVPLKTETGVLGCLTFASTTEPRRWSDAIVRRFELTAQVFARALAAKRTSLMEREQKARLETAASAAGAGLWEYEIATGRIRATDVVYALLDLPAGEELTAAKVVSRVHPDDRQQYEDRLAWFRNHEESYTQEYRLLLADGTVRWINSRGTAFATRPGQPPDRVFGASIDITERKRAEQQLQQALADLQALRDRLQHENRSLRDEAQRRGAVAQVVGTSAAIRAALVLADQVAPTGATVLLLGETGTGKERFANYIHAHSPRRDRTMVRVNCASIPTTLIESELFGREKGAYTGALTRQIGRFELASGSTIFLDEIGDLPMDVQVKLLRVIEERCIERLGNPRPVPVDVRIIAATHRDLKAAVRAGHFREDLYYRLNVFPLALPPLRDRLEDLPLLARAIVDELSSTIGRRFDPPAQASLQALRRYPWPGNIRELRNVIERAMITSTPPTLQLAVPHSAAGSAAVEPPEAAPGAALTDVERAHILGVLARTGWRIRGPHGAAAILGLPPTTLENRMKRLGISRPRATGL